jgi:hypothetical protein
MKIYFAFLELLYVYVETQIDRQTDRQGKARNCVSATFHHEHAQKQYLTDIKLYLAAACLTQQVRHNSLLSEGC